jgi:SAM-dependent methyltransferase
MVDAWESRNDGLAKRLAGLVSEYGPSQRPMRALDIGTQHGTVPSQIAALLPEIQFQGIEPGLSADRAVVNGIQVYRASCDALPFPDASFEVVTFASVFEHITPGLRVRSLSEIHRVLVPHGVLVGQMPNMRFPIELHSRLPLQQFLPRATGDAYLRVCSPVPWRTNGMDWFRVGPQTLRRDTHAAGFRELQLEPYNPPRQALPTRFRGLYPLLNLIPLGYTFAYAA